MDFWGFLTFLWTQTVDFMNVELPVLGFTLFEFIIGSAVISLIFYAIWRILK